MNSLERIFAAIEGNGADYQPFTLVLSLYGASLTGCDTQDYYRKPELYFEGQKKVIDMFEPDIILSPFAFPFEAEAFGSQITFLKNFGPNVSKPIITKLSDIDNLQIPDIEKSQPLQFLLKSTELLSNKYKNQKAVASLMLSPVDLPALLTGAEMWIDTLLFYPAYVDKILQKTTEYFVKMANSFFENGTTALVVSANFANPMMITEKIFQQLLPYLKKAFERVNGPIIIHQGGCKILPFIDRYSDLPNVLGFFIDSSESFDKARKIVGDKTLLLGNIDGPSFAGLTKEKAKDITLKILNNRKNDKHFVFSSSNADIPYDTPPEIIKTVVETIKNYTKK